MPQINYLRIGGGILALGLMSFIVLPAFSIQPKIQHAIRLDAGRARPDPFNFMVGDEKHDLNSMCRYLARESPIQAHTEEAKTILKLRDKASDWYGVSYMNGFLGAFLMLSGGIWYALNGPSWLFFVGLGQHASAYVTGYFSSEWNQEAYQRAETLIKSHNSANSHALKYQQRFVLYTFHY